MMSCSSKLLLIGRPARSEDGVAHSLRSSLFVSCEIERVMGCKHEDPASRNASERQAACLPGLDLVALSATGVCGPGRAPGPG